MFRGNDSTNLDTNFDDLDCKLNGKRDKNDVLSKFVGIKDRPSQWTNKFSNKKIEHKKIEHNECINTYQDINNIDHINMEAVGFFDVDNDGISQISIAINRFIYIPLMNVSKGQLSYDVFIKWMFVFVTYVKLRFIEIYPVIDEPHDR